MLKTPDRRKSTQMCRVNMLKPYYERGKTDPVLVNQQASSAHKNVDCLDGYVKKGDYNFKLCNAEVVFYLDVKLAHLLHHKCPFPDIQNRTIVTMLRC